MNQARLALVLSLLCGAALLAQDAQQPAKPKETKPPRLDLYGDPLPEGALARMGTMRLRPASQAAFTPNGKEIVTGSQDLLRFWDADTGKLLREAKGGATWPLVFSPDGRWLATMGLLRDGKSGRVQQEIPIKGYLLTFSRDSTLLVARADKGAVLWNIAERKQVALLEGHEEAVEQAVFTTDGGTLLTVCPSRLCYWDAATGKLQKSVRIPAPDLPSVRLSTDAKTLAVAVGLYSREAVELWDTETGKPRLKLQGEPAWANFGLAFSPDGKTLATSSITFITGSNDGWADVGTLSLWDTSTGKPIRRFKAPLREIRHPVFAPDGRTILTSGDGVVLWDSVTGKRLLPFEAHEVLVSSLDFTPDGRLLVSAGHYGGVRVWETATGRHLRELIGHRWGVHAVKALPDGRSAASCGADGSLRVWDLQSGKETRRLLAGKPPEKLAEPQYRMAAVKVAPGGKTVTTFSGGASQGKPETLIQVWNLATGRELNRWTLALDFLPRYLDPVPADVFVGVAKAPTAGEETADTATVPPPGKVTVVLRDIQTGRVRLSLPQPLHGGYSMAISPDGRTLATITYRLSLRNNEHHEDQHSIYVWELSTGKEKLSITIPETGQQARLGRLVFSRDHRLLATERADNVLQVWDVATGKELVRCSGYDSGVFCLTFAPDGRSLATGHLDGTILLWDLAPETWLKQPPAKADDKQLESHWSALAGEDAKKAHAAIWALVAVPEQAAAFLKQKLTPVQAAPADKLKQSLSDLDSPQFARRERAAKELADLEELAHPALQEALKGSPSPEQRRRIEALLNVPRIVRSPENLRRLRAIEALEHIGTAEAREVLESLAKGAAEARATQEAKASLERLARAPGR